MRFMGKFTISKGHFQMATCYKLLVMSPEGSHFVDANPSHSQAEVIYTWLGLISLSVAGWATYSLGGWEV